MQLRASKNLLACEKKRCVRERERGGDDQAQGVKFKKKS